jgi:hypothetical protein
MVCHWDRAGIDVGSAVRVAENESVFVAGPIVIGSGAHSRLALAVNVHEYVPPWSATTVAIAPDPFTVVPSGLVITHVYVGVTGGIAVLVVQYSRQIPPSSTTPLTVNVIVSPIQAGSALTSIVPSERAPLS